ncbi:MAG: DUF342 domain-containing protein [Oligoflexales bacterium]|nr:DUF342 domain-containing protein [Oligoflexales bacterium]
MNPKFQVFPFITDIIDERLSMNIAEPKLTFIAKQQRIRCEFSKAYCDLHELPPADLISRAIQRLEKEQRACNINFFRTYEARLQKMWELIRTGFDPPATTVAVTLASGSPELRGIEIFPAKKDQEVGRITIKASSKVIGFWQPYFLKLTIAQKLGELGIYDPVSPAQIQRLWYRARNGVEVSDIPLIRTPHMRMNSSYSIIEEEHKRDITLILYDTRIFYDIQMWKKIFFELNELIQKGNYHFLYDELNTTIRSASRGPERFGIDLPIVMLAAIDYKYVDHQIPQIKNDLLKLALPIDASDLFGENNRKPPSPLLPLEIEVSSDKKFASISQKSVHNILKYKDHLTEDWLRSELKRLGIAELAFSEFIERAINDLKQMQTASSLQIAEGKAAKSGDQPFVKINKIPMTQSVDSANFREQKSEVFFKAKDTIAKIDYEVPAQDGYNVYGDTILAPIEKKIDVICGSGVSTKDGIIFIAEDPGRVIFEQNTLRIEKHLAHKGNVNLNSGNIRFPGSVDISGSVDSGATVETGGELKISGSVTGGILISNSSITINEGINNHSGGYIKSGRDVKANFAENSFISCSNLNIKSSLMNSTVNCAAELYAGNIVGGHIYSENKISCSNLGSAGGVPTILYIGFNPKFLTRIEIRKKRLSKIKLLLEEYQKKLEVIEKNDKIKHKSILEKEQQLIIELNDKIERCEKLKVKATAKARAIENEHLPNIKAYIEVKETLFPGVVIHNGINEMKITQATAGTAVIIRKNYKMKLVPLEQLNTNYVDAEEEKEAS